MRNIFKPQKYSEVPPGQKLDNFADEDIRNLGNLVLRKKKDIKFNRLAETRAGAQRYADKHGLLLGADEDINDDGVNDVVLYNKYLEPVMINGYSIKPSEYPYRTLYQDKYGEDPEGRFQVGGYKGFMQKLRRNQFEDEDLQFPVVMSNAASQGFVVKKPIDPEKERLSNNTNTYKQFFYLFRDVFFTNIRTIFQDSPHQWLARLIPQPEVSSILYIMTLVKYAWNDNTNSELQEARQRIIAETNDSEERYNYMKKWLNRKVGKAYIYQVFRNNTQAIRNMIQSQLPNILESIGVRKLRDDVNVGKKYIDYDMLVKSGNPQVELQKKLIRTQVRDILHRGAESVRRNMIHEIFGGELASQPLALKQVINRPRLQALPLTTPIVEEA